MSDLRVGAIFYGYCQGYFGRDGFGAKRIEAIGADWIVCRYAETGHPTTVTFSSTAKMYDLTSRWLKEPPEPAE